MAEREYLKKRGNYAFNIKHFDTYRSIFKTRSQTISTQIFPSVAFPSYSFQFIRQ